MIFQSLVMILPRFFDFERPYLSPWTKIKKSEASFVAMSRMNRCAKFHKDSPSGKKVISRERLNFRGRPFLCTTLYRNLMQARNFGGTFDQLFL